jgi:glycosyltransferase involved in cell wall biosynthesis
MRFSIITPTYRRAEQLTRAVKSLQNQTYKNWEMIIINDSPSDKTYQNFASFINDPRIHYHINDRNMGVNYSRNRALDRVSAESHWVLFLDDDDYLSPDALQTFHDLAVHHNNYNWFLTNRAYKDGTPLTKVRHSDRSYSYAWDCLLLRRLRGDATHAIKTKYLHSIRFSKFVKQGEEWLFFYQLGLTERIFYHDHNSTITAGYDPSQGLNFRKRTKSEQFKSVVTLFYEGIPRKIAYHPTFILYLFLRMVRIIVPN